MPRNFLQGVSSLKKANVLTGTFFLALSIFSYVQTLSMASKIMTDELGPSFWPKYLSIAMGLLALGLIFQGLFAQKKDIPPPIDIHSEGFCRVVKLALTLIVFGAVLYFLGIYVGILFMMPVCMLLHGERSLRNITFLTVCTCMFIYLVFDVGLRVPLPMGLIFS